MISVHWVDLGRESKSPPNADYPKGMDIELTGGSTEKSCKVELPYPAKRVGYYVVTCARCKVNTIITTAGRPDDPRSVRLPCKGTDG